MLKARNGCMLVLLPVLIAVVACSRNSDRIDGPKPVISGIEPQVMCLEQGERELAVRGDGLAPLVVDAASGNARVLLPQVFLVRTLDLGGGAVAPPQEVAIPEELMSWKSNREITALLKPALSPESGIYHVRVKNGSGHEAVLERALVFVPPPQVDAIEPVLACAEQSAREFLLTGRGFLQIGSELPKVFVGNLELGANALSGCVQVPFEPLELRLCTSLRFEIAAGALPPGKYQVTVENPAAASCQSSDPVELLLVPPPELLSANPDLLCLAEADAALTLSGKGFLEISGVLPKVTVGALVLNAAFAKDCVEILTGVRSCAVLDVVLPKEALAAGAYAVSVENPPPAGCASRESVNLAVIDPPSIEDLSPEMFCAAQSDAEVTVTGTNFLKIANSLPQILVGVKLYPVQSATDCAKITGTLADAWLCKQLVFKLPAGDLPPSAPAVRVLNPPPAACGSSGGESLVLLPAPEITRASPAVACDQNASQFNITGRGFLKIGSNLPTVVIKGQSAQVLSTSGCVPLAYAPQVEACTALAVRTAAGIGQGAYLVTLQNPGEHACSDDFTGFVGPPPVVSAVSPLRLCQSGGVITVTGSGFGPGAMVSLTTAGNTLDLETAFIDANTLQARLPDPTPPGLYDVTVANADGCADTLEAVLDIVPVPIVFFVDPPVTYNGINLQVTLYTSGILGTVTRVTINPHDQPAAVSDLTFTFINTRRTQTVLPAGLAAGDYDVEVEDNLGCRGRLPKAFTVVGQLTVAIERIELPFGWRDDRTGVNVYSPVPAPGGTSNFKPTPRLYLNPSDAGAGALASELKYVAYVSPDRVSATVPAGMAVGQYDLVAVNPDGGVGLLGRAFKVTELPPPEIYQLLPSSVVNQSVQNIKILGANFRNPAFSADCLQPDSTRVPLVGTITASDATSIAVSINFTNQTISDNSICIVTVTNDDGVYVRYSALAVTNPSLNLDHFRATSPMNTARRAPCAAAGQAQAGARFLYAIGGDNGTSRNSTAGVYHNTVELAPIDPYGILGAWQILPFRLPAGRSFHGCVSLGRYIYIAGGNGGAGPEATVWRTKILDPEQTPEITDVDLVVQDDYSANLTPGRYSYRVSSLRPGSDVDNPGGESLASDPFMIQVPNIAKRLAITITWSAVPDSVGYRIYRTPAPDLPGGEELLMAEVAGSRLIFTDDGSVTPSGDRPLPLGALGRFQALPFLNTQREGAAFIGAADPQNPEVHYLYVMGGRSASSTAVNTVERLAITILADGRQQWSSAWTANAANIGEARWQLGAWRADQYSAPGIVPANESWIYAGGGIDAALQFLRPEVVAMKVAAGGALGECTNCRYVVDSMQPFKAGYATASCNKQLFAFGGTMANAATESASIELCPVGGACSGQIPDPPDLANWNNLGINLTVPRYLMGGVTESAFVFLVGGIDATPQPLRSTEKTLW